ncbi:MAG: Gfo/Idh/MocA family protein [Microcoleaceae cyanobacterium]
MAKPTQIAILGAGRWGTHLIRNFLNHSDAEVIGIADPYTERLDLIQDKFPQLSIQTKLSTNWSDIVSLPELEAVVIATPASTHYDLISDALRRGCHVFVEKPLTLKLSKSLELCDLAKQCDRQLFVDHTFLFHPAVHQGRAAIQAGAVGDLRYGYAARTHLEPVRQDVDVLWDLAIHDICIFNTWLGEMPIQVQATGTVWLQTDQQFEVSYASNPVMDLVLPGLADMVMLTLTYSNGFRAFIHLCWSNPDKQRRLAMVGNQGTLIFDEMQRESPLTLQRGYLQPMGQGWRGVGQEREVIDIPAVEPLAQVCDHFLRCARENQVSDISSGVIGAELVKVLCGLSESLRLGGQPVNL